MQCKKAQNISFFRQFCEGELVGGEGHGFYGVLLCSLHCASLRRGNQGDILLIWEGTEVPKRYQMCSELCSAWLLVKWQHSFGELGKCICLSSNTLGQSGHGPAEGGLCGEYVMPDTRALPQPRPQCLRSSLSSHGASHGLDWKSIQKALTYSLKQCHFLPLCLGTSIEGQWAEGEISRRDLYTQQKNTNLSKV